MMKRLAMTREREDPIGALFVCSQICLFDEDEICVFVAMFSKVEEIDGRFSLRVIFTSAIRNVSIYLYTLMNYSDFH